MKLIIINVLEIEKPNEHNKPPAISKKFLVPLRKSPMANKTCFLIGERPKFMMTILSEYAICKKI